MGLFVYLALAYIQAVLVVRLLREQTAPGTLVMVLTIFAPVVTVILICRAIHMGTQFLLNVGRKP
jgi:hypothetical protein